jgi:hypothetical protein
MAYKTKFTPKNPNKYIGDWTKIICRSLWERNVCKFFDDNPYIKKWAFEEIAIPYTSPIDKKIHNYFPDFLVEFDNNGDKKFWMIEVKPKKQTFLKENASKRDTITWIVNQAKWKAAEQYCSKNNIEFKIITEKEIFANATNN